MSFGQCAEAGAIEGVKSGGKWGLLGGGLAGGALAAGGLVLGAATGGVGLLAGAALGALSGVTAGGLAGGAAGGVAGAAHASDEGDQDARLRNAREAGAGWGMMAGGTAGTVTGAVVGTAATAAQVKRDAAGPPQVTPKCRQKEVQDWEIHRQIQAAAVSGLKAAANRR